MTHMRVFRVLVLLIAACKGGGDAKSGAAASGGGDQATVASCTSAANKSCKQYSAANVDAAGTKYLTELCTMVDKAAVFAMTPCSTANLIGKCATREGTEFYYQGFAVDVATLAKECPDGHPPGTWTPGA